MRNLNPYLIFEGNCRQAMEFYNDCLGGVLYTMKYSEMPGGNTDPKIKDCIIHARLTIKDLVIMASDAQTGMSVKPGNNSFICLTCEHIEEIEDLFGSLSENAHIDMRLQETFWAIRYGMLTDQFGIKWILTLDKPKN